MRRGALTMIVLATVLAGASVVSVAASSGDPRRTDHRRATECGTVDKDFVISVAKGDVPCPQALAVSKTYLASRRCGSRGEPACVAEGFHCRMASFEAERKTELAGYCYVLRHPLPAAKDRSPYRLSSFRRAIAIYLPE